MTKFYVIANTEPNTPGFSVSQRNLARTMDQARLWSWPVTVWPATQGHTVTAQAWQDIAVELLPRGNLIKRPGARGCWFSHWRLWQHCVDVNEPLVILEHDAYITAAWPSDIDLDHCLWKLHLDDGRGIRTNTITGQWSCGAYAYTLTPAQAQRIIDFSRQHGAQAVDKQLGSLVVPWQYWHSDLAPHRPSCRSSTTSPKTFTPDK